MYVLHSIDSTGMKLKNRLIYSDKKQISHCLGLGGVGLTGKGQLTFEVVKMFYINDGGNGYTSRA